MYTVYRVLCTVHTNYRLSIACCILYILYKLTKMYKAYRILCTVHTNYVLSIQCCILYILYSVY